MKSILLSAAIIFAGDPNGQLPAGWHAGMTGRNEYFWRVKKDTALANGFVEVKFKPISGKEDQAGGVVWRWKDADNYYVARANALEDNVRIYHVVKGKRTQFGTANAKVAGNVWHSLRVDFAGKHFVVTFDSRKLIEADDATISGAGAVGVWTKADSVTVFDEFSFEEKR